MGRGVFRRPFRPPSPSQSLLGALSIAAAAPVNADLAVAEADDTLVTVVALDLLGALAVTEANDLASVSATLAVTASASIIEADDPGASGAALAVAASRAAVEGDDEPSAAGAVAIAASLAAIEAGDAFVADAALGVAALVVVTEDDDTFSGTAQMPIFHPRRGGIDEREEFERRQREWQESLRRIVERSFLIADGIIDPVTFEAIPPPDHSPVIDTLLNQARSLDRRRAEDFIAERKRLQEDDAMAILLLAA